MADRTGMSPLTAVGISALIFLLIPIAQMLSGIPPGLDFAEIAATIPPPIEMEDVPPPQEDEQEVEPPDMKEAPPPPSIEALDFLLNPDISGIASADLRLPDLDVNRDDLTRIDLFDISDLDERPMPLVQVQVQYPEAMRRAGIGGRAYVLMEVDQEGVPRNLRVESSPNPAFDRPIMDAVRQWRFSIGRKNGRPVAFRMRLPLVFDPDGG